MTEVICLFAFLLDCFYRCCWFLPLEFSNFDLGLKGSIFFSCALHENYGCTCLVESARTSLTIPSPLNKHEMWHYCVPVLLVLFFLLSVSFLSHFCTFPCFFFLAVHRGYSFWTSFDIAGAGAFWSATLIHHSLKQNQHPLGLWSYRFRGKRKAAKERRKDIAGGMEKPQRFY